MKQRLTTLLQLCSALVSLQFHDGHVVFRHPDCRGHALCARLGPGKLRASWASRRPKAPAWHRGWSRQAPGARQGSLFWAAEDQRSQVETCFGKHGEQILGLQKEKAEAKIKIECMGSFAKQVLCLCQGVLASKEQT